ncbi:hypothetical protein FD754_018881, partial [Muntiacus muntjak]
SNICTYICRKNNWPPLPDNFPVGPCFYQDFSVDIPVEFQKTVKIMYYLWMFHAVTLFLNIFGCLAWFCVDPPRGVDFGLSILWFLLFTPCSFVCWYRPLYGAFSMNRRVPAALFLVILFMCCWIWFANNHGLYSWMFQELFSGFKQIFSPFYPTILVALLGDTHTSLFSHIWNHKTKINLFGSKNLHLCLHC